MKKRRYPKNPDCPLTKAERVELGKVLDDFEWTAYLPLKHLTSGWSDSKVIYYDEYQIEIEVKWGNDGEGWSAREFVVIERSDLITVKKN